MCIRDSMYTAGPDGYCGDEDNGQTSAWYVFSALGFYPVSVSYTHLDVYKRQHMYKALKFLRERLSHLLLSLIIFSAKLLSVFTS